MKVALLRFLLAALGAMMVVRTLCAQTQQGSDFWPEMQLHYRIDGANQAIGMLRLRDNLDRGQPDRAELGVMFNHSFTDYFTGGIGYRHQNSTYGNAYEEDRAMGEQTFRIDFPSKVSVDFRTRENLRWLHSGFSAHFRERAQVSRPIDIDDYVVTPYASVEVYFDTRYD